jgi:hypothetical protein
MSNYLRLQLLYSRRTHFYEIFLINIFENKILQRCYIAIIFLESRGSLVVKAVYYKLEGRGFETI